MKQQIMTLPNKRKKTTERPATGKRIAKEKPRYLDICKFLMLNRIATHEQIMWWLDLKRQTVDEYLRHLFSHHYVYRRPISTVSDGRNPLVYSLDKYGEDLLRRHGYTGVYIPKRSTSPQNLPHFLGLTEIMMRIRRAAELEGSEISREIPEHVHYQDYDRVQLTGYRTPVALQPDWYFVVELPNKRVSNFFVEFDRSSENIKTYMTKIKTYVGYHQSGAYQKRYDAKGFRVLSVIEDASRRRLNNLIANVATVKGIQRRFWLAHLDDLKESKNILTDPFWTIAGDVANASLFDMESYRSDTE
jgi:hypothetical protein